MNATSKATVFYNMSPDDLEQMIDRIVENNVSKIKIPDPAEEKYYTAEDNRQAWGLKSRGGERSVRNKAIELGLLHPVEISPGVIRYRRSEIMALDLKRLKYL